MRRSMMLLRHLLAVAALPFVMAVLIPAWIARGEGTLIAPGPTTGAVLIQLVGLALGGVGAVLFVSSLRRFATDGEGTLAPWDPPRRLVVHGPYRYVRNPMISGVVAILLAEALVLRSWPHLLWAAAFLALNAVHIPLVEEPQLRRRFGAAYDEYRAHVPRLLPRWRPWRTGEG